MFKSKNKSLPCTTDITYLYIADKSKAALNILTDLLKTYLILARKEQINSYDKCEHFCLFAEYFLVIFSTYIYTFSCTYSVKADLFLICLEII